MGFLETINQITWPAALAIVGSIVTIVVGLLGYLRSTKPTTVKPNQTQAIHDRVSGLKDKIAELDGDVKAIVVRLEGIERSISDHEARDVVDFKALSAKVEKIMEIIVEMLRDER